MTFTLASTDPGLRASRVRTALRIAATLILTALIVLFYAVVIPQVFDVRTFALLVLVIGSSGWAAYLGATLAGARAHSTERATIGAQFANEVTTGIIKVALALERLEANDTADRAAAATHLMQVKGAANRLIELSKTSYVATFAELGRDIDHDATEALLALSGVEWIDEAEAAARAERSASPRPVDEPTPPMKH